MWISKALLLSCFVLIAAEFESDADLSSTVLHRTDDDDDDIFCAAKFRVIENHSACLQRSKNNPGVSEEDQKMIVEMHNGKRSSVQPEATNMLRLSWDDEVAMIAQKWADKCDMKHEEKNTQRDIPGRFSVGQNIAMGAKDWWYAIEMWHDEVKDFKYGSQENSTLPNIGNYTQMVWAETNKIGCGFSVCNGQNFHVCNYAPSINLFSNVYFPYKSGPSCSECQQGNCSDSLCDCGFTCLNGGTIDTTDCTCKCLNDFYLEPVCRLMCKEKDPYECYPGYSFSPRQCDEVAYHCPVRCRHCPYAEDDFTGLPAKSTAGSTSPACSCWFLLLLKVLVVIFCKNFT